MSEKILSPSACYLHGGGFSMSPSVANTRSLSGLALLHVVHNTEHEGWRAAGLDVKDRSLQAAMTLDVWAGGRGSGPHGAGEANLTVMEPAASGKMAPQEGATCAPENRGKAPHRAGTRWKTLVLLLSNHNISTFAGNVKWISLQIPRIIENFSENSGQRSNIALLFWKSRSQREKTRSCVSGQKRDGKARRPAISAS